ncbi:b(0,+)-type amino acid transporter 1-like isoform X5 [Dermacentor albipictus]|uniref:b(0,+)-type amino acid transporter 1-like isoform X5 n=1 Tax=Dermacentor albipictus TaxID=60249 RepID=UPI0038FD0C35
MPYRPEERALCKMRLRIVVAFFCQRLTRLLRRRFTIVACNFWKASGNVPEKKTRDKKFSVHMGAAMEQGSKDAKEATDDAHIRLKRQLGWVGGTAVLVGNVVGSGIFVTPSLIFRNSESVGVALLIWCLSGMLSLMGAVTALNCVANKTSSWLQATLSTVKCLILLSIVITGAVSLARGKSELEAPFFSTSVTASGILSAFYGALLSFSGWKYVSFIAEEMADPVRNLQRSLMAGLLIVTVMYVLTNLSYAVVLDFPTLTSTDAIASAFALRTWGAVGHAAIPVAVSVSVFGALCASFFSAPRFVLSAARTGHLPRMLSLVTIDSRVPFTCVIFRGALSVVFVFFGSLQALIQASVFVETLWDIFVVLSLLLMRFTMKNRGRSYRAPLVVVLLKLVSSVALVVIPLVQPTSYYEYLVIVGIHIVGLFYYLFFVGMRWHCRAARVLTETLQKLMPSMPCFDELSFVLDEKKCNIQHSTKELPAAAHEAQKNLSAHKALYFVEAANKLKGDSLKGVVERSYQKHATTRRPLNASRVKKNHSTIASENTKF